MFGGPDSSRMSAKSPQGIILSPSPTSCIASFRIGLIPVLRSQWIRSIPRWPLHRRNGHRLAPPSIPHVLTFFQGNQPLQRLCEMGLELLCDSGALLLQVAKNLRAAPVRQRSFDLKGLGPSK